MILEEDVLKIQKAWSDGLLKIVDKYHKNLDYIGETNEFIDSMYGYDLGEVLFKPTLACDIQFRLTKEDAMSYFIANLNEYNIFWIIIILIPLIKVFSTLLGTYTFISSNIVFL